METGTIIAIVGGLLGILVSGGSVITFWMNFSNRIGDATAKAESAGKQAATSVARVIALEKELTELRVKVAEEYVSKDTLGALEKRIIDAINNLGGRLDSFAKAPH